MNKVKTPGSKLWNNNKLTIIFGSAIAIIFLLFVIKAYISKESPQETLSKIFKSVTDKPVANVTIEQPKLPPEIEKKIKEKGFTPKQYLRLMLGNRPVNHKLLEHRKAQDKLIRNFKKKIHLDMEFPVAYDYIDIDLDENVAAMIGTSLDGKKSFTVIATNQKVSVEDAIKYVKSSTDAFPFLSNHRFLDKKISFTPPESTGLKPLTIVPASTHQGQGLYVALTERKDNKGTYMFMIEAPYQYFDANEDGLERMLGTVKAKP